MQQQMVKPENFEQEGELDEVKAQLSAAERDRNRAFEELREIKLRLSKISGEKNDEFSILKECLQNADREVKSKEKTIESLQAQIGRFQKLELKLSQKEDEFKAMREKLNISRVSLTERDDMISNNKKKVEELEDELGRRKETEAKLFESLVEHKHQLQEASFLIEKHRSEATSIRRKLEEFEEEIQEKVEPSKKQERFSFEDGKPVLTTEDKSLLHEINVLKIELKQAIEAEENKDKALEDLALALKEVATESNQAKEKLISTEHQLEAVKEEALNLKKMVKSTELTYDALMKDLKKENDRLTNIVNRLRLEADESLYAWSVKEIEFVKCIKKADDDKITAQVENNRLMKSIREVEEINEKSKEEAKKLRDILKQALNEANVAKEAAELARSENSYLQDSLAEKDKALVTLAQETERLRISEAEANETIKELKRIISSGSKKEVAKLEKESKDLKKVAKKETGAITPEKEHKERKLSNTFSFDLNQFWPSIPGLATKASKDLDDDPNKDDALGGSIFDLVESPEKGSPSTYHRRTSPGCSSPEDETHLAFEPFDEDIHFDDMEAERTSQGKKKALLRRFGDLLKRKNFHTPKDLTHQPKDSTHQSKDSAHLQKDSPHPPKDTSHQSKDSPHPSKDTSHQSKDSPHAPKDTSHQSKDSPHPSKDSPHYLTKDSPHPPKDSHHPPKDSTHQLKESSLPTKDLSHATKEVEHTQKEIVV